MKLAGNRKNMAQQRKRTAESADLTELKDYMFNVSPIKISRSNSKYFNAQIQTQHKTYNVVGFAAEKHQTCMDAQKMSSPVKLEQFKFVKGRQEELDVQLNKMTRIELLPKLDFKKKTNLNQQSSSTSTPSSTPTITKVADIDMYRSYVTYNIRVRVLGFTSEENEEVTIYGSKKQKREGIVADDTGRITVSFFEDLITQVAEGNAYTILNVSSRNFRNKLSLTTTGNTIISKFSDDFGDVSDVIVQPETLKIEGGIVQVQCNRSYKCFSCDKNVTVNEDANVVKCDCCKLKSKVSSLKTAFHCRINLQDGNGHVHRLICFQSTMEEFLSTPEAKELLVNPDELEDFLLNQSRLRVVVAKDSDILSQIEKRN